MNNHFWCILLFLWTTSTPYVVNTIVESIHHAKSYLFLMHMSMLSCSMSIDSEASSIIEWPIANNCLFLLQFSILSRFGNILSKWTHLLNDYLFIIPLLSCCSHDWYILYEFILKWIELVYGIIMRIIRFWENDQHCYILQGVQTEMRSIDVSICLGYNDSASRCLWILFHVRRH